MKILVGIKRALDYAIKSRVRVDGKWMETDGLKHSMNPFDEIALEEALRIREKGQSSHEITVASCGGQKSMETIRSGLAMGADKGILIDSDKETSISPDDGRRFICLWLGTLQPLTVAKVLAKIVNREKSDLVLLGKQAIDDDAGQTGQMLAGLLGWPQATFASEIKLFDSGDVNVTSEIDGGLQEVKLKLPAVITVDLRLNEPRLVSLQNIMKAKKKPVEVFSIHEILPESSDLKPRLEILDVSDPPPRPSGRKVESVDQLLELLQKEAKVLEFH